MYKQDKVMKWDFYTLIITDFGVNLKIIQVPFRAVTFCLLIMLLRTTVDDVVLTHIALTLLCVLL